MNESESESECESELKVSATLTATKGTYVGLLLISLATLAFEILLTRLFSATMFYHFTFMVLSLAMFGLAVGATLVYLFPRYFNEQNAPNNLSLFSVIFGISTTACMLFYLFVLPFVLKSGSVSLFTVMLVFSYLTYTIPFICSGICTCVALTRFKAQTGKLYAADLLGAALACLFVIAMLFTIDAPSAILINSAVSALAALCFATTDKLKRLKALTISCATVFGLIAVTNLFTFSQGKPLLGLEGLTPTLLYQKWTPMSFVTVQPSDDTAWGWSIDPELVKDVKAPHKSLLMDRWAGTPLYEFNGDLSKMEFLKLDVSNVVHSIRPTGSIFIIGIGGGRDILASLLYKYNSIVGAEFNNAIINVVKHQFADYTGHIDKFSGVEMVNDEARCFLTSSGRKFDVVQASLIDTFAATAGGGLALTENSLYTADGWKIFISHLTDTGVLSFTYPYSSQDPSMAYRLCCMACQAMEANGITDLRQHMAVIGSTEMFVNQSWPHSEATLLVSIKPFTEEELLTLEQSAKRTHHKVILNPHVCIDEGFLKILDKNQRASFVENYWADISAPTDDRPFFLCMAKVSDYFGAKQGLKAANNSGSQTVPELLNPLPLLFELIKMVAVLTVLGILLPLTVRTKVNELTKALPLLVFFSSIGFGFMLIEISQLTRLSIFLGHPVFGLTVVLFTLLVSSGLGSLTMASELKDRDWMRLVLVVVALAIVGVATPYITTSTAGAPLLMRILLSVVVLSLPGFFMGMALPLGMLAANVRAPQLAPWLWGMNGATSVLGSVMATLICVAMGVQATFLAGIGCYVICLFSFLAIRHANAK